MPGANSEQLLAIEHTGGVLLSAGAGSGKTFVLIEHIVYLLNQESKRLLEENVSGIDFKRLIKNYCSKIVLMTFTKKAAGELKQRLESKIEGLNKEGDNPYLWNVVLEVIDNLNVTTIHGFCFKLISSGYIPEVSAEVDIINTIDLQKKISGIVEIFLDDIKEDDLESELFELYIQDQKDLIEAMVKIFSMPELRVMWDKLDPDVVVNENKDKVFRDILSEDDFLALLEKRTFVLSDKDRKLAWGKTLGSLASLNEIPPSFSKEYLNKLEGFLNSFKSIRIPKKDISEENERALEEIKGLKKFFKKYRDDFFGFLEKGHEPILVKLKGLKNLYEFVKEYYRRGSDITFSDLEYEVFLALEDENVCEKVGSDFKYLIVDEFQDTSFIQYEIIKKIANNDFRRLFCVGDEKQAIYGFRGGELAVFNDCKKNIPRNLNLSNNYRSQGNIIDLNNHLFQELFQRGIGFEGADEHAVEVVFQRTPLEERVGKGRVFQYRVDFSPAREKEKVSPKMIDDLESKILSEKILSLVERTPDNESICVLYSKLGPSLELIGLLSSSPLLLEAQVKVELSEDPIISIFKLLIDRRISLQKNESQMENQSFSELINAYFRILDVPVLEDRFYSLFSSDVDFAGPYHAFIRFLFRSGVSCSNYRSNLDLIHSICRENSQDLESISSLIGQASSDRYSLEFATGKGSRQVKVMTAHASKGLEFKHVFLGGIHTNGRKFSSVSDIGVFPGALKWKERGKRSKKYRTLEYIYEKIVQDKKDFSESKRLFYVACTRAEESLHWANLSYDGAPLRYSSNSWIEGVRCFEHSRSQNSDCYIQTVNENLELSLEKGGAKVSFPIFHADNLGIVGRNEDEPVELGMIPELSVTKLAQLVQCPRKFFLKNICKLDGDEFSIDENLEFSLKRENTSAQLEEEGKSLRSSAGRGTLIHEVLSNAIMHNFVVSLSDDEKLNDKDKECVKWALANLRNRDCSDYVSEELVKFELFGQMISGIPDLILNKSGEYTIVDFKTGRESVEKERPYWFQLDCYAIYLFSKNNLSKVTVELMYVDEQKSTSKSLTKKDAIERVFQHWKKTKFLYQENPDHCHRCEFGNLCLS